MKMMAFLGSLKVSSPVDLTEMYVSKIFQRCFHLGLGQSLGQLAFLSQSPGEGGFSLYRSDGYVRTIWVGIFSQKNL